MNSNLKPERVGIHKAVAEGNLAQVQALIKAGANINQQENYTYETPLNLAVQLHHVEIMRALLDAGATITPSLLDIISEEEFCYPESLAVLIESGIDINTRLEDGETVLMRAAQQGDLDIVKMLINAHADPNIVSRKANFALLAAGHARNQELFEYLIPLTSPKLRAYAADQLPTWLAKLISKYDC